MQPLNQRIRRRHYLQRLSFEETREYIYFRLVKAGSPGIPCFEDDAIQRIFVYSNGIPRSVNNICDCCLTMGALHGLTMIDDSVVLEAIKYIEGNGAGGDGNSVSSPEKITGKSFQGNDPGYHPGNYGSEAQLVKSLSEELRRALSASEAADSKRAAAESAYILVKSESATRMAELTRRNVALTDELGAAIAFAEQLTREKSEAEEKLFGLGDSAGKIEEQTAKVDLLNEELKKMAAIAKIAVEEKVRLEEKLFKLQQHWEKYVAS